MVSSAVDCWQCLVAPVAKDTGVDYCRLWSSFARDRAAVLLTVAQHTLQWGGPWAGLRHSGCCGPGGCAAGLPTGWAAAWLDNRLGAGILQVCQVTGCVSTSPWEGHSSSGVYKLKSQPFC